MTALLIDDERLAREELRLLLQAHPQIDIVGEAASITTGMKAILQHRPDLIFLDINLRGESGFDLLAQIDAAPPHVVFVTAHDAFAIRAFECSAVDYLLKPIRPDRLASALSRLPLREFPASVAGSEGSLENGAATPLRAEDRVFLRDGDRCWFVPILTVRLIEAEGNYSRLRFDDGEALIYRSLNSLEQRLPVNLFLRANRSQIINLSYVERIELWFSNCLKAWLRGTGEEVEFSRRASATFRERSSV